MLFLDNRTLLEFKNVRTAVEEATEYFHLHPENDFKTDTAEDVEEILKSRPMPASIPNTYGVNVGVGESSFRHKSNHQGLIKDFGRTETKKKIEAPIPKIQNNYNDVSIIQINRKINNYSARIYCSNTQYDSLCKF